MNKEFMFVIGVIVVLILAIASASLTSNCDESVINNWADENHYQLEKIERTFFDLGPFWIKTKHDRIYRVDVKGKDKPAYFRFNLFGHDTLWMK